MNERKYNNQTLTAYLLGSLSELDVELFDELSVTDTAFVDDLKLVENDLIDSYICGELASDAQKRFEAHYLQSPLRREKVDFARTFQTFAERNSSSREISEVTLSRDQKPARFFSVFNIFANPVLRWGFVGAALILIAGSFFWILSHQNNHPQNDLEAKRELPVQNQPIQQAAPQNSNSAVENEIAKTASPEIKPEEKKETLPKARTPSEKAEVKSLPAPAKMSIAFFLMPSLRDAGQIQSLAVPKQASDVKMQLQLEADDYPEYRVALVDQMTNKSLWVSGKIRAASKGTNKILNMSFPANLLKSQIYSLNVTGISADSSSEIISNYPFRAVVK